MAINRTITEAMKIAFNGYVITRHEWFGRDGSNFSVQVAIPNKWSAYIDFSYTGEIILMNYHGPGSHVNFQNVDINNVADLESILSLTLDYIDVMCKMETIKESCKNVSDLKSYTRNKRIEQVLE